MLGRLDAVVQLVEERVGPHVDHDKVAQGGRSLQSHLPMETRHKKN